MKEKEMTLTRYVGCMEEKVRIEIQTFGLTSEKENKIKEMFELYSQQISKELGA